MDSTWLLHKPVSYGSALANGAFLLVLAFHIVGAAVSPIASIVALATKKGGRVHLAAGRVFLWAMVFLAVSGAPLDALRMLLFVKENNANYEGFSSPSPYPARFAFFFCGLCVLYLARVASSPQAARATRGLLAPGLLLATGLAFTVFIYARLDPWTGNLWMIWTFCALVAVVARMGHAAATHTQGVARHRLSMISLAAFSWWGVLQSFGPALVIARNGVAKHLGPYVGDQQAPFRTGFFKFLIFWMPFVVIGAFLVRRFARKRQAPRAAPVKAAVDTMAA